MKSNKNLLIILVTFLALALVFYAYTQITKKPVLTNNESTKNNSAIKVNNNDITPNEPNIQEDSAPLTQGNSLDDIRQDLDNTNIVEEDLTDLK